MRYNMASACLCSFSLISYDILSLDILEILAMQEAVAATKPSFIVDDINGEMHGDDITSYLTEDCDSDGEDDHFDSVCAICDNGGSLTWYPFKFSISRENVIAD